MGTQPLMSFGIGIFILLTMGIGLINAVEIRIRFGCKFMSEASRPVNCLVTTIIAYLECYTKALY